MTKKTHSGRSFHHGKEFMNRFYNLKKHDFIYTRAQPRKQHSVAYMHHLIENI